MSYNRISLLILLVIAVGNLAMGQSTSTALGAYRQGTVKLQNGDLDGAIRDFTQSIEISSHLMPDKSVPIGSAPGINGFRDLASDGRRVTVVDPLTASAYVSRGYARYMKHDIDGALADWEQEVFLSILALASETCDKAPLVA